MHNIAQAADPKADDLCQEFARLFTSLSPENQNDVSKKVQYLIVGEQDEILVGCDGLSSKEEKAAVLNQKGAAIATISEQDFLKMLL